MAWGDTHFWEKVRISLAKLKDALTRIRAGDPNFFNNLIDLPASGSGTSGTDNAHGQGVPTGSGSGGSAGSGDKLVIMPAGCTTPVFDRPFCSDSFSFDNFDLRPGLKTAAASSGHYNPSLETIISFQAEYHGAAYGGVTVAIGGGSEDDFGGSGGSIAGVLTSVDAAGNNVVWHHSVEQFGVSDVLQVFGYRYGGRVNLENQPDSEPIALTGEMSQLPILASCHTPHDENDPAWLKICLISFVKLPIPPCLEHLPYSIDFTGLSDIPPCWLAEFYNTTYHGLNFEGNPGFGGGKAVGGIFKSSEGAATVNFTLTTGGTPAGDYIRVEAVQVDAENVLSTTDIPISFAGPGTTDLSLSAAVDGTTSPNGYYYVRFSSSGKVLKTFAIAAS